jgi:hypothetical protein
MRCPWQPVDKLLRSLQAYRISTTMWESGPKCCASHAWIGLYQRTVGVRPIKSRGWPFKVSLPVSVDEQHIAAGRADPPGGGRSWFSSSHHTTCNTMTPRRNRGRDASKTYALRWSRWPARMRSASSLDYPVEGHSVPRRQQDLLDQTT